MRQAEEALPLRHVIALGLLQGPAELLPVSSSGHTALIPWLAGWPYVRLDGKRRKSFEVALHVGAGLALAIDMRGELLREAANLNGRKAGVLALAVLPAAIAGYALQAPIERRLGEPRSIAAGLAAGGVAMALADRRPGGSRRRARRCEDARAVDGLALGIAQASALIPGVSRNGATLAAARARGFSRGDADRLSWLVALPVILGAGVLEGWRLIRRGEEMGAAPAIGGAVAFLSTLASARTLRRGRRAPPGLLAYSLYRCLLAALVARRLRRAQ
jgi:undecaprenyl-diphosphatase